MPLIREMDADITFVYDGVAYGGTWSTYEGGALSAADAKARPGNTGRNKSVGGPADRSDATITQQHSDITAGFHNALEVNTGRPDLVAQIIIQYKNGDGTVMTGAKFSRVGTLKTAELPSTDNDSGTVGMYSVVLSCDEIAP